MHFLNLRCQGALLGFELYILLLLGDLLINKDVSETTVSRERGSSLTDWNMLLWAHNIYVETTSLAASCFQSEFKVLVRVARPWMAAGGGVVAPFWCAYNAMASPKVMSLCHLWPSSLQGKCNTGNTMISLPGDGIASGVSRSTPPVWG